MANNVSHRFEGDKLVIEVDMSRDAIARAPASSSGKTRLVGSTGGFDWLSTAHHGAKVGISVNVSVK